MICHRLFFFSHTRMNFSVSGHAVVQNPHVAHLDTSEIRPLPGLVGFDDFGLRRESLAVLRDEHQVVGQHFLKELGVGSQLGESETFLEPSNLTLN
jgi:hypothetical protein